MTSQKKIALSKGSAKSISGIISGKKKIVLSRKQKIATVLVAALAVVGVGFGVYNYTYMNESFAGGCISNSYKYRSRGICVEHIQSLNNYFAKTGSPIADTLAVDGIFGDGNRTSIRKFQKYWGLSVDGVVGPKTWNILCAPQLGSSRDPYKVPSTFPISAARGAGCPGAYKFHY